MQRRNKSPSNYINMETPRSVHEERISDVAQALTITGRNSNLQIIEQPNVITKEEKEFLDRSAISLGEQSIERLSYLKNGVNKAPDADRPLDSPEFQWRSVIIGTIIGCIMAAQNVYFGLRNGNSFGDGIVASLIGFAIIKVGMKYMNARKFDIHEHIVLQTAATANISTIFTGGFSTYILAMTPEVQSSNNLGSPEDTWTPTYWMAVAWLLVASFLGFFLSQPFRTKLVVEQDLPWPSSTATAVVCKALHDEGNNADKMTKCVGYSALGSFGWQFFKWLFDGAGQMEQWPVFGPMAAKYTWTADWSLAYIAGGMLMSWNAVWSQALGGLYGFGFIYPYVTAQEGKEGWYETGKTGMEGAKAYWYLTSLALAVTESFYQSLKITMITIRHSCSQKPMQRATSGEFPGIELEPPSRLIPTKLWCIGFILNAILVIVVIPFMFGVPFYLIIPVILIAIPLGYGICLGGAITDSFVISAIGKLIVILFGAVSGNIIDVLWLAGIGMITVGAAEMLLADYRVGYLTATSPWAMFKAQFFAALVGCFITPLSYNLFINAFPITLDGKYTAPGGVGLRALAVLFVDGFDTLPGHVEWFIIPTCIIGLINSILIDTLPKQYSKYLPNTMAFAIGFYIKASYPLNSLIGALINFIWKRVHPKTFHLYFAVVAGGLIAGEGLAAVVQAILSIFNVDQPAAMRIRFGP